MKIRVSSLCVRASSLSLGAALFSAVVIAAFAARAETAPPIKIAVFDFELEDYSAGGGVIGETPEDIAQLKRATDERASCWHNPAATVLVDVSHADAEPAKSAIAADVQWLRG